MRKANSNNTTERTMLKNSKNDEDNDSWNALGQEQ